jgi:ribosome-associated translation inhibitor RaiA
MNRILVVGDDTSICAQARPYAEYRVFTALGRHTQKFRRVRVVLRQRDDRGTCETMACAVTVALEPSGPVRIRATDPHVYAAINRTVERLSDALGERVEQRQSS